MKFTVDLQLLVAVLMLVIAFVSAVGSQYASAVKANEECHCGYVLEERVELHCRPQKRQVKVLSRKGNCVVSEKPMLVDAVDQPYSSYRFGLPVDGDSDDLK